MSFIKDVVKKKEVKIEATLNETIMLKLVRCKMDMHKSYKCSMIINDCLKTIFF